MAQIQINEEVVCINISSDIHGYGARQRYVGFRGRVINIYYQNAARIYAVMSADGIMAYFNSSEIELVEKDDFMRGVELGLYEWEQLKALKDWLE